MVLLLRPVRLSTAGLRRTRPAPAGPMGGGGGSICAGGCAARGGLGGGTPADAKIAPRGMPDFPRGLLETSRRRPQAPRSGKHTFELHSRQNVICRLFLAKKNIA